MAAVTWIEILFNQGAATFEAFTGQASKNNVARPIPPAFLAARFSTDIGRAVRLAEAQLARTRDAEGYYQLGAGAALAALYKATVEGRTMGALSDGRRAVEAMQKARDLDPARRDTGLVLGMSRYTVSILPWYERMFAGIAGLPGDRAKAFALLEEAASPGAATETDALLVLMVVYNREGRHADAMERLGRLQARFPGNRLLWLNAAATAIEARNFADADRHLADGAARHDFETPPRVAGEHALWLLKSGTARAALGRAADARADLARGLTVGPRDWVRGRIHYQLAKLAASTKESADVRTELAQALDLARRSGDTSAAHAAQDFLRHIPDNVRR